MNNQVQQVQVRAVIPLEGSYALFLGNSEKTFVIYIDEQVGGAISMFMRSTPKERPLTHDLMASVLEAFGGKVERVVINDVHGKVFYARLILTAENELQTRKVIEIDARPSDSVAMAVQQNAPIYVANSVWNEVPDATKALAEIESRTNQSDFFEPGSNPADMEDALTKLFTGDDDDDDDDEEEEDDEDDEDDIFDLDDEDDEDDDLFDEDDDDFDDDEDDEDFEDDDDEEEDDDEDEDDDPPSRRS
jgi:uncharacterized protein